MPYGSSIFVEPYLSEHYAREKENPDAREKEIPKSLMKSRIDSYGSSVKAASFHIPFIRTS